MYYVNPSSMLFICESSGFEPGARTISRRHLAEGGQHVFSRSLVNHRVSQRSASYIFAQSRRRSAILTFTDYSAFLLMRSLLILTSVASITPLRALAQAQDTRGQPRKGGPGTFEIIGQSLVSAQQVRCSFK